MSTSFHPTPALTFHLINRTSSKFSPRLGQLTLTRPVQDSSDDTVTKIDVPTPGLICSTTRGIIQHLSRDNVKRTPSITWVHVPFESFLQIDPPVPTQQQGCHPLHTFLGFPPGRNILSMSLRDPADWREMPPNGKLFVTAQSLRGARKVTCPTFHSYVAGVLPDIVFPLSDVPFTPPPQSQKRINKSIERSTQWLRAILSSFNAPPALNSQDGMPTTALSESSQHVKTPRLNIFLPMVGGIKTAARAAFAAALQEPLEQNVKELLAPFETLDDGVSGYVFDLVPLRMALLAEPSPTIASPLIPGTFPGLLTVLIKASLTELPEGKPRLANTTLSPHEVLTLIRDAGIDLFDTFWAQQAATWGVALDFRFPVPGVHDQYGDATRGGKHNLGHNLYESRYAHDFKSLADSFVDGLQYSKRHRDTFDNSGLPDLSVSNGEGVQPCPCAACSPVWENGPLSHSSTLDKCETHGEAERAPAYTRAYVHHLLHTHEMSAHALLVMHNLAVMDAFMRGVRGVLTQDMQTGSHPSGPDDTDLDRLTLFTKEVARFERTYDASLSVLDEARVCWAEVDRARGKGRLARERKLAEELGTDVPVAATLDE